MAKRRTTAAPADSGDTWRMFALKGGPRSGDRLRLAPEPRRYLRLAIPEWATYEWDGEFYTYLGPEPPPKVDLNAGRVLEKPGPVLAPGEEPAYVAYRDTEAYRRGVAAASEVVA